MEFQTRYWALEERLPDVMAHNFLSRHFSDGARSTRWRSATQSGERHHKHACDLFFALFCKPLLAENKFIKTVLKMIGYRLNLADINKKRIIACPAMKAAWLVRPLGALSCLIESLVTSGKLKRKNCFLTPHLLCDLELYSRHSNRCTLPDYNREMLASHFQAAADGEGH